MKRLATVIFLSWITILGVLLFQGCTPIADTPFDIQPPYDIEVDIECNEDECCPPSYKPDDGTFLDSGNFLSGRYHLRGRTKRFFGRVS